MNARHLSVYLAWSFPVLDLSRPGLARRSASVFFWAMAMWGLVWLLAWALVPWAVKTQLERRASAALGRAVTVGQVQFRPWSLELVLHDFAVARAAGPGAQLEIKRIYIDAALQSLVRWAPVVDALQIDAPVLRLARAADGRYDIDDVVARLSAMAPEPAPAAAHGPARFALYKLGISDGAVDLEDEAAGRRHSVRALNLTLPFLSTLAAHRAVVVKPRLAFLLNGSAFETTADATPFAQEHRADVRLQVRQLDLAPFAAHAPAGLPLRLQSGRLDADLRLAFEQSGQPSATLTGTVAVHEGRLLGGHSRELIGFDALRVSLQDVQPLKRLVQLEAVEWEGLRAELRRGADGLLEWPGPVARPAPPPASAGAAWTVAVHRLAVADGRIGWTDLSVQAPRREARHVQLLASDVHWPLQRPLRFSASADLPDAAARIALSGQARNGAAQAALSLRGVPLDLAGPYLRPYVRPRLGGAVDADLGLAYNGPNLVARVVRLAVNQLEMDCGAALAAGGGAMPCASLADAGLGPVSAARRLADARRLEVSDAWVRWPQRTVSVGRLLLSEPRMAVSRDASGRWMFDAWRMPAAPVVAGAGSTAPAGAPAAAPWQVRLDDAAVEGGALAWRDEAAGARPVALRLASLQMRLRDFVPLPPAGAVAPPPPSSLSLSAQVASGSFEPGRLSYDGTLRASPLELQGRLQASHLPLQALEPYFADRLQARVVRAEGSFAGDLRYASGPGGPATALQGDLSIDEVRVLDPGMRAAADRGDSAEGPSGEWEPGDLLRWKALGLRGLRLGMETGRPVSLQVRETALNDFFARVVLQENGRLNLQDLLKPARPGSGGSSDAAGGQPPAAVTAAPRIRLGPATLAGGRVQFSDRFVRPSYSTDLSELAGRLGAFSSADAGAPGEAPQMAELELRGKAEATASVEITGRLNPLARPPALDIRGRMRDLELPPLSPYSVKYAGHAIERGKLAADVSYRVLPDGQLTASNRVVLRQLAFGDPVEGAPASLPVRLAVALLADREGVIDVDLPVSGSLNDPQFSLGAVVWRALGNLVLKAVTSPFSLLAGAFGGTEQLDRVGFQPGSAALDTAARAQLDQIARALADRPALTLTVVGEAALEAEREGWKRQRLQDMVLAEKRRTTAQAGQGAVPALAEVGVAEYPGLLKEIYRRADMPKPRNLIGLARDLPQADMENLLLARMQVPADAMHALAVARGAAVRDYLARREVPRERLFIGAPRIEAEGESWAPRASLSLQTR